MYKSEILNNLNQLVLIEKIVQAGSLYRAAELLNISQPSLSVKIKNLENSLSIQIFQRTKKGILLTKDGEIILKFSKQLISLSIELESLLVKNAFSGSIKLGIYESIAKYFWPQFYKKFKKDHPSVDIQISVGRSLELIDLLDQFKLDAVISIDPEPNFLFDQYKLFHDDFNFYTHKDLKINEVDQIFYFGTAHTASKKEVSNILVSKSVSRFQINQVGNFEVAAEFCLEKMGIALLPNRVADFYSKNRFLKIIKLGNKVNFDSHNIVLTIHKKHQSSPLFEILKSQIKENY